MTKCSTRHEYADLEGRGFCIGLKLIEVKAHISAMSGGISFYIGLKSTRVVISVVLEVSDFT